MCTGTRSSMHLQPARCVCVHSRAACWAVREHGMLALLAAALFPGHLWVHTGVTIATRSLPPWCLAMWCTHGHHMCHVKVLPAGQRQAHPITHMACRPLPCPPHGMLQMQQRDSQRPAPHGCLPATFSTQSCLCNHNFARVQLHAHVPAPSTPNNRRRAAAAY
jgi:hypothetical protein